MLLRTLQRAAFGSLLFAGAHLPIVVACHKEPTKPTIDDCATIAENMVRIVEIPSAKTTLYEDCKDAETAEEWSRLWCIGQAKTLADLDRCSVPGEVDGNSKSEPREAGRDIDEEVRMAEKFADDMCACSDPTCGEKVATETIRYGEEVEKKGKGKPTPAFTAEQGRRIDDAMKRFTGCIAKAKGS